MKDFLPSNGTMGDMFFSKFCFQCIHERWTHFQDEDKEEDKCEIMSNSMIYEKACYNKDLNENKSEWKWDGKKLSSAKCLQFQKWDWDKGDYNDEKIPYVPDDPSQLVLFTFSEKIDGILINNKQLIEM